MLSYVTQKLVVAIGVMGAPVRGVHNGHGICIPLTRIWPRMNFAKLLECRVERQERAFFI
ncbi:hypothetical protein JYU34_020768 [Plutella xylostella]|uniref:Uncharacterized protein n=1 Tax=Plutella xylostella TaxID=51655 RepID=A0ABQ7PRX9_PLUXY|nr:hypothetical protein JYU34_020768 [Plutella xylostella]